MRAIHWCVPGPPFVSAPSVLIALTTSSNGRLIFARYASGELNSLEKTKLIDESLKLIVAGDISPATRETLMKQIDETKANDSVAKVVGLILGTPEFQRQ
jgi:hypothetical protein